MKKILLIFMFPLFLSAQSLQTFVTIESKADLYNYDGFQNGRVLAVLGNSVAWDQPTEFWTYDTSSTATSNGVDVIKPTGVSGAGRFLFKSYLVRQYGTAYSKEWNGSATTSSSSAVFDISSAGFTSITSMFAQAVLPGGTVVNLPISAISAKSNTSVTINLLDSKTTTVLILNTAVEGLETHSVANTEIFLTVRGK